MVDRSAHRDIQYVILLSNKNTSCRVSWLMSLLQMKGAARVQVLIDIIILHIHRIVTLPYISLQYSGHNASYITPLSSLSRLLLLRQYLCLLSRFTVNIRYHDLFL